MLVLIDIVFIFYESLRKKKDVSFYNSYNKVLNYNLTELYVIFL